jgi:hypothetical protein
MPTPYFTPPPEPVQNTTWKGQNYDQMARAFEKAFILTTVCAWCNRHMSGPERNTPDRISHGICEDCAKVQMAAAQ